MSANDITRGETLARNGTYTPKSDRFGVPGAEHAGIDDPTPPSSSDCYDGIPPPEEPPDDMGRDRHDNSSPTTWEPVDLGPFLRGDIKPLTPSVGAYRTDGHRMLYPGLEHSVIAHTGAGKTWFALLHTAAEILAGNTVLYLHFEESTPASTVERLLRIGLPADTIERGLLFVAPSRPVRHGWLTPLLAAHPTLVVIDGVNEAMVLHGAKIDLEGWSAVRRTLVVPFKETGAAVLECDHLPLTADPLRGDAYGTVHKGNVIDGARFALVRKELFGRGRRGVSHLFATKDRPGYVNESGKANDAGHVFLGTLVVDDSSTAGQDFITLYAPKDDDGTRPDATVTSAELANLMYEVVATLPDHTAESGVKLRAAMRAAGHKFRRTAYDDTAADLVHARRFEEIRGQRGSIGYRAVTTLSQEESS